MKTGLVILCSQCKLGLPSLPFLSLSLEGAEAQFPLNVDGWLRVLADSTVIASFTSVVTAHLVTQLASLISALCLGGSLSRESLRAPYDSPCPLQPGLGAAGAAIASGPLPCQENQRVTEAGAMHMPQNPPFLLPLCVFCTLWKAESPPPHTHTRATAPAVFTCGDVN